MRLEESPPLGRGPCMPGQGTGFVGHGSQCGAGAALGLGSTHSRHLFFSRR